MGARRIRLAPIFLIWALALEPAEQTARQGYSHSPVLQSAATLIAR